MNLSQGFPDFNPDQNLIDAVTRGMNSSMNQYAPMTGLPALREAISQKVSDLYSVDFDPNSEITVTAGATQAIFTAIQALIGEDDEVLIFQPAYDCYVPAIELANGRHIFYNLEAPSFKIDWDRVKKLINHNTRMIIINTPHNPTGRIWSEEDMLELEKIVVGHDILVLSDEVYEHIVFDNELHQSALRFPGLRQQSVVVSSFGKTYHCTGWKVGYAVGPAALMKEFNKVHQYNVFSVNTPAQVGFAEISADPSSYENLGSFYQERRDYFRKGLKESKFELLPCEGSYFQLARYDQISNLPDQDFVRELTSEYGVAAIPVSSFYQGGTNDNVIRFCFAKSHETLDEGIKRLCAI